MPYGKDCEKKSLHIKKLSIICTDLGMDKLNKNLSLLVKRSRPMELHDWSNQKNRSVYFGNLYDPGFGGTTWIDRTNCSNHNSKTSGVRTFLTGFLLAMGFSLLHRRPCKCTHYTAPDRDPEIVKERFVGIALHLDPPMAEALAIGLGPVVYK